MPTTLAAAGRWVSSSKKSPCPLCGRNTDDKCRRREGVIHCYQGSRFGPPPHLKRSDVLTVEGSQWYVADLAGGFSGAHVVLKPHTEREGHRPVVQQARRRKVLAVTPKLERLFQAVQHRVQAALAVPEFQHCTLREFQESRQAIAVALELLPTLRETVVKARQELKELGPLLQTIDRWHGQVTYQQWDAERFARWGLGEPTAAQVARLQQVEVSQ